MDNEWLLRTHFFAKHNDNVQSCVQKMERKMISHSHTTVTLLAQLRRSSVHFYWIYCFCLIPMGVERCNQRGVHPPIVYIFMCDVAKNVHRHRGHKNHPASPTHFSIVFPMNANGQQGLNHSHHRSSSIPKVNPTISLYPIIIFKKSQKYHLL